MDSPIRYRSSNDTLIPARQPCKTATLLFPSIKQITKTRASSELPRGMTAWQLFGCSMVRYSE